MFQSLFIAAIIAVSMTASAASGDCYLSPSGCVLGNPNAAGAPESTLSSLDSDTLSTLALAFSALGTSASSSVELPGSSEATVTKSGTRLNDRTKRGPRLEDMAIDDVETAQ